MLKNRFTPHILFEKPADDGADTTESPEDTDDGKKSPEDIMPDADADALRKALREKRDSEAKYRKERNDFKDELGELKQFKSKVESIFGEDDDPEEKVKTLEQENRQLKLERDISKAAKKHNADEELVTAVLMRNGDIDGDIDEAVKQAVEKNPKLKAESAKTVGDGEGEDTDEESLSMNDLIRKAAGR